MHTSKDALDAEVVANTVTTTCTRVISECILVTLFAYTLQVVKQLAAVSTEAKDPEIQKQRERREMKLEIDLALAEAKVTAGTELATTKAK